MTGKNQGEGNREADRRYQSVSPVLQPPSSTREPGPTLALDAFPRGCLAMNNLFDIHT